MKSKLQGTLTALITPFKNGKLDEAGLRQNIRFQMDEGIKGIVPLGTTGEAATLSAEEHSRVISVCLEEAGKKIPVIVGTGSNCTRQTIERTKKAKELGADAVLVVAPYYNKPTQEGIFRHFEAVAQSVKIPLIVYNNPGRSVVNIEPQTMLRLAGLPTVIGLKDSPAQLSHTGEIIHEINRTYPHFSILSGDDALTFPMMALGANGVISVVSNLVPRLMGKLVEAMLDGRFEEAKALHYQLLPICQVAFIETNPSPIKAAMNHCGMAAGECRLPLVSMDEKNCEKLKAVLKMMRLHDKA